MGAYGGQRVAARIDAGTQRLRDRQGNEHRVADGCQIDEERAIGVLGEEVRGDPERDPGLPRSAGSRERDEPM